MEPWKKKTVSSCLSLSVAYFHYDDEMKNVRLAMCSVIWGSVLGLCSDRKVALYGDVRNVKEPSVIMPKLLIAVEWRDGTEHRNTEKFGTSAVSLI